ncbi:MAG: peptidylprolyl isomerase [Oscillospiraceae bacterium]|jgi:parvulin-like peptidyl-prolyl isomerase|nr:peptidylprolyl isomerase [Oscillospiraceae bacterium]
MKKITAAVAALVFALALAACSAGNGANGGYEPGTPGLEVLDKAGEGDRSPPAATDAGETDVYKTAFAKHKPDDIVVTFGGYPITWDVWFYLMSDAIAQLGFTSVADWSDADGKAAAEQVLAETERTALQLAAVFKAAEENGVKLTEGQWAELAKIRAEYETQFGGEESLRRDMWDYYHATMAVFNYLNSSTLYQLGLIEAKYGADVVDIEDGVLREYFASREIFKAKHILLKTVDDSRLPLTDEEIALAQTRTAEVLALLAAYSGTDFGAYFDELLAEYNEDTGEPAEGYVFTPGQMVTEFEDATRNLGAGEYTAEAVETIFGYHIILRLPHTNEIPDDFDAVDPDSEYGGTYRETVLDAHYQVFWEAHYEDYDAYLTELQNGLAAEYGKGFEKLDLAKLFG